MESPTVAEVTNKAEEKEAEAKQGRVRRTRPLPGLARKVSELARSLDELSELARKVGELAQSLERQAGLARKIIQLALNLEETARLENERNRKDDDGVRAILNTATGGAIERLLRSMNLSETQREFLKDKRWRV